MEVEAPEGPPSIDVEMEAAEVEMKALEGSCSAEVEVEVMEIA